MVEGSNCPINKSSVEHPAIERYTYTSKDHISFEVHLHLSMDIFRAHRRIYTILRCLILRHQTLYNHNLSSKTHTVNQITLSFDHFKRAGLYTFV
ncbi:hypothetical protein HanIR_Chr02g0072251 [Helianthus annuus]|nr:hypothetical protein HanIR_Chr02g0072251 [Helianthus annuus]